MVKLSVTAFADEETETPEVTETTEATTEKADSKSITVPLSEECQTRIVLKLGTTNTDEWVAGFRIYRSYDCEPFDAFYGEEPDFEATQEDAYRSLGDAVVSAAERASWWLVTNTGDSENDPIGCQAHEALDNWKQELDPETITESCFDEATNEERNQAADEPAEAKQVDEEPATTSLIIVTDEAQKDFENRKSKIEEIIGRLAIEATHIKASMKINRESTKGYTEELENHINCGPERLPLFELQGREQMAAGKKKEAATPPKATEEKKKVADPSAEAWRTLNLKDLPGLTPKIIEILDLEGIRNLGEWVDFPARRGIEYTQIKNTAGAITEVRLEKIAAALMVVTTGS